MKKMTFGFAALAALTSTTASAETFAFTFDTTSTAFGGPAQTIRGFFETLSTPVDRFGQTGLQITGISGTINGAAITGLFNIPNNPYYYITSGATFLDGSGVRFNTATATNMPSSIRTISRANHHRVNGKMAGSRVRPGDIDNVTRWPPGRAATWARCWSVSVQSGSPCCRKNAIPALPTPIDQGFELSTPSF